MTLREYHLPVVRTARYWMLGEPGDRVRDVWFVCHGYGQLARRFIAAFEGIGDPSRLIVAPEALSRFYLGGTAGPHGADAKIGATWMTREDRLLEIEDYVRYLDALHGYVLDQLDRARVRVTVLGFSQGAATASRWTTLGDAASHRLVLWGGFLPADLDLNAGAKRLTAMRLTVVLGTRDELVTPAAVEGAKRLLERHGVPSRIVWYDGGHRVDPTVLRALADERPD